MIRRPPRSTLSLHDALPISVAARVCCSSGANQMAPISMTPFCGCMRSEEHTSELQSQSNLVCRLLLEKKKHTTHLHPSLSSRRSMSTCNDCSDSHSASTVFL